MPKGGKRKGAGRPKGSRDPQTVAREQTAAILLHDKEQGRLALQAMVFAELQPLVAAQIANAKGLKYLVTRDKKTGKFLRVTETMARLKQGDGEEHIEVWEKDPSVQAFTDLMNRTLDKPAEQVQEIKVTASLDLVAVLQSARRRLADARKAS